MSDTASISAIHLFRTGNHVLVAVEAGGHWVTVIQERHDGQFSHIVEASGIREALGEKEIEITSPFPEFEDSMPGLAESIRREKE